MVFLEVFVGVPGIARSAVIDLNESDAAFRQPAGRQADLAEGFGALLIHAVEALCFFALVRKLDGLGSGHLHAEGKLVGLDTRRESGV